MKKISKLTYTTLLILLLFFVNSCNNEELTRLNTSQLFYLKNKDAVPILVDVDSEVIILRVRWI